MSWAIGPLEAHSVLRNRAKQEPAEEERGPVETTEPAGPAGGETLREAEQFCAAMARREAKNFYWGFIVLPRPQRMAIYALYDFARQVDDEADRPLAERDPARLEAQRQRLADCLAGVYRDPVMHLLGVAVERYGIPGEELAQVIDGVAMDLQRTRYQSWDELRGYCALVASAVGRMCVRIFGYDDARALAYADELGYAMQLTNILRDVREDYRQYGRIYLPLDDLRFFGVSEAHLVEHLGREGAVEGMEDTQRQAWGSFVQFEVARARTLFDSGLRVSNHIPRASAACVRTMAGIYQGLLREIERDPTLPLTRRVSLSAPAKLGVLAKSWLRVW